MRLLPKRSAGQQLDAPTTQALIDLLPKQMVPSPPTKGRAAKGLKHARWAPHAGGDDALFISRQRERRPDLEARQQLTGDAERLFIVLVGLPARGKSIIANKLSLFLNWRGWTAKAFSAGALRRQELGQAGTHARFFDAGQKHSLAAREKVADAVTAEALAFFDGGGRVAIFDASNTSTARRARLRAKVAAHAEETRSPIDTIFLELLLESPTLLLANMLAKVRASPDFYGKNEPTAMDELRQRCVSYEKTYCSVRPAEGSFIQIYDNASRVVAHHIFGRCASSLLPFLIATHFMPQPVLLVSVPPAGEGEAPLVAAFARDLAGWAAAYDGRLQVLCSTSPEAALVAAAAANAKGVTPERLVELSPSAAGGGESPADLSRRLEKGVFEVEKQLEPTLVVAHEATCRALRAYLLGVPLGDALSAASSAGAAALADGSRLLLELSPGDKVYQMSERVVELPAATREEEVRVAVGERD